MKKIRLIALAVVLALTISAIVPLIKAGAEPAAGYEINFQIANNQQGYQNNGARVPHTMSVDNGGNLSIDGGIVELRDTAGNRVRNSFI